MKSRLDSQCTQRESLLQLAAAMLRIIDASPRRAERRLALEGLGVFDEWQLCPGSYHAFLSVVLSAESIPEDAKLRLLTMGRPRALDSRSFVLNHPLLAADMLFAICESPCAEIVREQRLDVAGLRPTEVISALMRESRRVRDPVIARVRRLPKLPWESEDESPAQTASRESLEAVPA